MYDEMEQEYYEEPDYNVWETNRVYEDMAIERREAEAAALDEVHGEALRAIVTAAIEDLSLEAWEPAPSDLPDIIVAALLNAGVTSPVE